jgi:hypothetical protein
MKEIMSYGNINKITVYDFERKIEKFYRFWRICYYGKVLTRRKGTVLAADLDKLITMGLGRSPPSAGDEHFQNKYERIVSKDALT